MEAQDQIVIAAAPGVVLGPALVRGVMQGALLVDRDGELHRAQLALVYPYQAVVGDVVLVMGQDDRFYVTGILDGKGLTRLDYPGDVELRAGGRVRIESGTGVEIDSERIQMRADRLDLAVHTVQGQFVNFFQRVQETLRTIAGRQRTTIEKESTLHARRIVRKAQGDVVVDGNQIKLG